MVSKRNILTGLAVIATVIIFTTITLNQTLKKNQIIKEQKQQKIQNQPKNKPEQQQNVKKIVQKVKSEKNNFICIRAFTVNVRRGPCTNHGVVQVSNFGDRFTDLGQRTTGCGFTWAHLRNNRGETVYAATNFLGPCLSRDLCFPVKGGSLQRVFVNWGAARGGGVRCHAGIDLLTRSPGEAVAITDGVVTNIFSFMNCGFGWGCASRRAADCPTYAVMIYHEQLDKTFNYGEIDGGRIRVRVGQRVTRGQSLGRAGNCGMLHVEVYDGRRTTNLRWMPPSGRRVSGDDGCARLYMSTKPAALNDPRPWISYMNGKNC